MGKKSRFCANCGKEMNKLLDNICPTCYSETQPIKVPKRLVQKVCSKCGAVLKQGMWVKTKKTLESNLNEKLKSKLRLPESEELKEVDVDLKNSRARIKASILGMEFDIEKPIKIELHKEFCKECKLISIKKPKIKIQLRFKTYSKSQIDKALTIVKQYKKFVQKVDEYRNGLDLSVKNQGMGNTLARKLSREFNCKMSRSVEQYGWNKQKNRPLHRHSILLRQI